MPSNPKTGLPTFPIKYSTLTTDSLPPVGLHTPVVELQSTVTAKTGKLINKNIKIKNIFFCILLFLLCRNDAMHRSA